MPWATVFDNVLLPLGLKASRADAQAARRRGARRSGGARGIRRRLSARTVRRHEDAGLDRARARHRSAVLLMDEPFAALDEITRFKLNNDLLELWQALGATVVFVTHSVFESVYLSSRIVVMSPQPGRVFAEVAVDVPYPRHESFRTSARIRRLLPRRLGGPRPRHGGRGTAMSHRRSTQQEGRRPMAAHRAADCDARARCPGLGRSGADQEYPAVHAAGTRSRRGDARVRLAAAMEFAAGHADDDLRGARTCPRRRRRIGGVVQSIAPDRELLLSLRGHPPGHAGRCDRAAPPRLPAPICRGPRLRLDRRVLPDPCQHHARAQFRRPQSRRSVRNPWRVAALRCCCGSNCRRRSLTSWAGSKSREALP